MVISHDRIHNETQIQESQENRPRGRLPVWTPVVQETSLDPPPRLQNH